VQGDAANTAGELANQQRKLTEVWGNAQAELGQALIPAIESLLPLVFDLIETAEDLVPAIETLAPVVAAAAQEFINMFDPLLDIVNLMGLLPGVSDETEDSTNAVALAVTGLGLAWQGTVSVIRGPVGLAGDFAVKKLLDMTRAADDTADSIVDLTGIAGVYSGAQALLNSEIEDAARAAAALVTEYDNLFRASQPVVTATGDLSGAQQLLNDEVENAPGVYDRYATTLAAILAPTEDLKEELGFVEQAFVDATEAVDEFRTATLELADPVFAAAQAQERLTAAAEALAEIRKDPKATDQAIALARLAEFEASLEADAAKLALGDVEKFIDLFVVGLDATREEVREILADIGIFTETEFGLEVVVTTDTTALDNLRAEIPSSIDILAAFRVPSIPTATFPDSAPNRLGDTGASGDFVFAPNIIHPTTSDLAGDLQQGAMIVSTIPGLLNRVR